MLYLLKQKQFRNLIKVAKQNLYGKVKIMVDPTSDLGYSGLTVEDDMKLKRYCRTTAALGKFVDKRTGKTGSLSDFVTANQFDSKNEEDKYFEPILDRLRIKGSKKKIVKKPKPPAEDKPKPSNVIPLPYSEVTLRYPIKTGISPISLKKRFEEFYARRIKEDHLLMQDSKEKRLR